MKNLLQKKSYKGGQAGKSEARNTKYEANTKYEFPNVQNN